MKLNEIINNITINIIMLNHFHMLLSYPFTPTGAAVPHVPLLQGPHGPGGPQLG